MSKYIIEADERSELIQVISVMPNGTVYTNEKSIDELEELNSDYINEHFGDLQDDAYNKGYAQCQDDYGDALKHAKDTAYKKGFEDGKAINDKGCEGCMYNDGTKEHSPCDICCNAYLNRWTAKQTDDEIKVGDVVMIKHPENHLFVVTKVSYENVWGVEGDGSWNYWPINEVIKTDKHFDIDKILEGLRYDN